MNILTAVSLLRFWVLITAVLLAPQSAMPYDILMFGNSITQGYQRNSSLQVYGSISPPNGARVNGSYGPQLENLLASLETSYAYNWGWAGELSSEGLNRIGDVLASRQADYILILEGANDTILGLSTSTASANLGYMVDKAQNSGTEPILCEMVPISNLGYPDGERMSSVYSLSDMVNSLALTKEVAVANVLAPLLDGWDTVPYQSGDGVHLSDQGYVVMANEYDQAILRAIQMAVDKEKAAAACRLSSLCS